VYAAKPLNDWLEQMEGVKTHGELRLIAANAALALAHNGIEAMVLNALINKVNAEARRIDAMARTELRATLTC